MSIRARPKNGAICVITAQPLDNIPKQYFSPNQAQADVVDWLKQIARCLS